MSQEIYRHELKYVINAMDCAVLRSRLPQVMGRDSHAGKEGTYRVRSLYFDTPQDQALKDKLYGVAKREKFRLRYYNEDLFHIRLEKKCKYGELSCKKTTVLTYGECVKLLERELDWMKQDERGLVRELYGKMKSQGLSPRTMSSYLREPYVYSAGNVRVTLDSQMRTGMGNHDFLHMECVPMVYSQGESVYLLEVKYDGFLPDHIRAMLQLGYRSCGSFSKYANSRSFG